MPQKKKNHIMEIKRIILCGSHCWVTSQASYVSPWIDCVPVFPIISGHTKLSKLYEWMTNQLDNEEILKKKKKLKGESVNSSFQKDKILIHLSEQQQKKI